MNNQIESTIKTIADSAGGGFDSLTIRIECPLVGGIKAVCWKEISGKKEFIPIPVGVRPFYLFKEELRKEQDVPNFNIIDFSVDKNGKATFKTFWDEKLQAEAEDNIRKGEQDEN